MSCYFCDKEDCREECIGFRDWWYGTEAGDQARQFMGKREFWLAGQLTYKAGYAACLEKSREHETKNMMALDYYGTAAMQSRTKAPKPRYVPKRVRLERLVRGDGHFARSHRAPPGDYEVTCNAYGAVSVRTPDGVDLGLRLDEFEVLEWQENSKREHGILVEE